MCNNFENGTNREVLEEQVAPVVLHVEEKTKDKHHVHQAKDFVTIVCFLFIFMIHLNSYDIFECLLYFHEVVFAKVFYINSPDKDDHNHPCVNRDHLDHGGASFLEASRPR